MALKLAERFIAALALAGIVASFALGWQLPGWVLALLGGTAGVVGVPRLSDALRPPAPTSKG